MSHKSLVFCGFRVFDEKKSLTNDHCMKSIILGAEIEEACVMFHSMFDYLMILTNASSLF